ncbi:unnamed protein product, partial [Tilletia controversa]
ATSSAASATSSNPQLDRAEELVEAIHLSLSRRIEPPPGASKFKAINKTEVDGLLRDLGQLKDLLAASKVRAQKEDPGGQLGGMRRDIAEIKAAVLATPKTRSTEPPSDKPAATKPSARDIAAAKQSAVPRVILGTQHLPEGHSARKDAPNVLLERVAGHLQDKAGIQALSVGRLHSGDLVVTLPNKDDEHKLLDDEEDSWIREAFTGDDEGLPQLRRPPFPEHRSLAIHGVPFHLGNEGVKEDIERIQGVRLVAARFFLGEKRREALQKSGNRSFGSAAIAFATKEDRDQALKAGRISCGNARCIVEPYRPMERMQQCGRCQQLGHVERHCRRQVACRICGRNHLTPQHKCACKDCTSASTDGERQQKRGVRLGALSTFQVQLLRNDPVSHPTWQHVGYSGSTPTPRQHPRDTPLPPHPRVLFYINKSLQTANVSMIGEPHPDLVSINIELALQPGAEPQQAAAEDEEEGQISNIHIHNLYNPVRSADTIPALKVNFEGAGPNSHHIVVGDFNAHHPLWESRVCGMSRHAHSWVEAVDDLGLSLLTPRDCPTYESREGRYSTIDLAWATDRLAARLVQCASLVDQEPSDGSDHIPVTTTLDLAPVKKEWPVRFNLRKCDAKQLATAVALAWQRESETLQPVEDSEGVEVWAAALQRAVRAGLEESAPLSRGCARSQPWFEHGDSRAKMNKARREWQTKRGDVERKRRHIVMGNMGTEAEDSPELDDAKCEAEVYRMRYIDVKREHHTSIGRAKKEYRKRALAAASGKDLWQLAKFGKGGANASMVAPLAMPEGGLATQAPAKAQILRTGFWPDKPQRAENDEDAAASEFSLDTEGNEGRGVKWESLGDREIAERIAKSKKGSAPGPDGASWEALGMIMRGWDGFVPVLRRLFNKCLEHGCHPTVFKAATTVVLRKPGKPDYTATGAYRTIALLNVMGKLLEALVAARILTLAERAPLLSKHHFGGRPHRSTEDALLQFQQFIDDSHRNKRHVLVISADVSGAYNGVIGKQLVRDLEEAGWPQPVIRWAASFMKGRSTALRLGDYTSQQMDLPDGLPQGSPSLSYSG